MAGRHFASSHIFQLKGFPAYSKPTISVAVRRWSLANRMVYEEIPRIRYPRRAKEAEISPFPLDSRQQAGKF